jgi:hypothetical protein
MATMASKFSQLQLDFIAEYYPKTKTAEIAKIIGVSESSIYNIAFKLRLKKSAEYLREVHGSRVKEVGMKYRFTKGQQPWNKGIKGKNNAPEHTLFKKGHVPVNYKPIGWTRIDVEGYHWTKVEEGLNGWVLTHRLAWEMEHGPIPKGAIIRFKDGNKLNFDIDNLLLIDPKQNMELNTIHRYPEEMQSTMKTISKLKKIIKNHGKEQN